MQDPFDLARFLSAQAPIYDQALRELTAGRKTSHWMWFIFPQLRGLGRSATAEFYGIAGLPEATAYLAHPTLGPRLIACTQAVLAVHNRTAHDIFGSPDDLKFHSSLTLFSRAASPSGAQPFKDAVNHYFGGEYDSVTLARQDAVSD